MKSGVKKTVLAYSGGLDTSVMLHWIKKEYGGEVICYCADLGQGAELTGLEEKARATGASKLYVLDLREEFVRDYVFLAIKANAVYEGIYLMGTSLARPVTAKHQVEIALKEGADAVAHGATGKGNDQVRFELTYAALAPELKVMAPWREWSFEGRGDLIAYAEKHGIPVTASREKPYSMDRNLMHISFEGGILEDPWAEPPKDMFLLTRPLEEAKAKPETLTIGFEKGVAVNIDGKRLGPVAMLERVNELGGEHGVGRIDLVENRTVGMKSRGVYETPGATILMQAHRALESICLDREVAHWKEELGVRFAQAVYSGFWFSPEFTLLRQLIEQTQERVTGDVRVQLYRGNVTILGRRSPYSLYRPGLASFEAAGGYNQKDAEGFIRLLALRLKAQPDGGSSHR